MIQIVLSIFFLSITGIIAFFIFLNHILHKIFYMPHVANQQTPADLGLSYENIFVKTAHSRKVQVWKLNPLKEGPVILAVHGWANTADKLLPLASKLNNRWNVALLNTRNHGMSDSDHYITILKYNEDINHTVSYIREKLGREVILLGHSLGAAASLLRASQDSQIKAVISISAFADLEKIMRTGFMKKKVAEWFVRSMLTYLEFRAGMSLEMASPRHTIKQLKIPVLLVHGTKDELIDFNDMNHIQKAGKRENIRTRAMKGHSHSSLLGDSELPELVGNFLDKYFPDL